MTRHVHLIDGNSIAHSGHSTTKLTVGDMQVQAIFQFLKTLHALQRDAKGSPEPIILWDGKAEFRFELFPEYKGNRKAKTPEEEADKAAFKRQSPFIEKFMQLLGVRQLRSPLLEADDLAAMMVDSLTARGFTVTLVSGDKDWIQLVRPGVTWFDPIRDRRVSTENFLEFTGYFTPQAFVQGKALVGDNSDNIEGIYKLGDKTAQLLLAEFKDMRKFFAQVDAGTYTPKERKSKTATSLHPEQLLAAPEGRALFERNLKLMDLSQARRPAPGELISLPCTPDADKFLLLCERLNFASIKRELHSFLRVFNVKPAAVAA